MSRFLSLPVLFSFLFALGCQKAEEEDFMDQVEDAVVQQAILNALTPRLTCLPNEAKVRFSNGTSSSQSLALYRNPGCATGVKILVSATIPGGSVNGLSPFACVSVWGGGYYPAQDGGAGCGVTPFVFGPGNTYTVISHSGGYYFEIAL